MAQCPECQNEVGDDFGLIICNKCGSSLFIDMEGNAISGQHAEADAGDAQVPDPQGGTQFREFEFNESDEAVEPSDEPVEEGLSPENLETDFGGAENYEPVLQEAESPPELGLEAIPGEELAEEIQDVPPEQSVVAELDFSDPEPESPQPIYSPPTTSDFKDVMDFANSDLSAGHDGSLKYHLKISGIDTTDLRNELKEALTDKRFIWDTEAMVRGIRDGILEVDQVSAVKAYILVSRVAHLPLQITWVQQPLNQP